MEGIKCSGRKHAVPLNESDSEPLVSDVFARTRCTGTGSDLSPFAFRSF